MRKGLGWGRMELPSQSCFLLLKVLTVLRELKASEGPQVLLDFPTLEERDSHTHMHTDTGRVIGYAHTHRHTHCPRPIIAQLVEQLQILTLVL